MKMLKLKRALQSCCCSAQKNTVVIGAHSSCGNNQQLCARVPLASWICEHNTSRIFSLELKILRAELLHEVSLSVIQLKLDTSYLLDPLCFCTHPGGDAERSCEAQSGNLATPGVREFGKERSQL